MKMTTKLLALMISVTVCTLYLTPSSTAAPGKVYDVKEFGAKGDGKTIDTAAIQKALDECGKAGGGIVKFSAGTYLSKPLNLRTKTTVLLEDGATLQATTNQSDFMKVPGDWLASKSGSDFVPIDQR